MESPEEATTENEHASDGKEPVKVKFRPSIMKHLDGSKDVIERNFTVTLRIKLAGITVQDFIGELGKTVVWGGGQEVELGRYLQGRKYQRITTVPQLVQAIEEGRTEKGDPDITIYAQLIDASEDSPVGLVRSKAAEAINDEAFVASSEPVSNVDNFGPNHVNQPADLRAGQGEGPSVDWSQVDIDDPTDFAPQIFSEEKLCELFGIPLPDKEVALPPAPPQHGVPIAERGTDRDEVDRLFAEGGDVIDDKNEEEMRVVHDKDKPDLSVGTFWSSMEELKMALKTYAVTKEFQARTAWTDKNRFTAKCRGNDGNMKPCRWYMSARRQPDGRLIRVNRMPYPHTCMSNARKITKMTSQAWVAEKVKPMLSKTPNTTAKRLQEELEKDYKCTISYSTVWKGKQRAMKDLYGDWGNTFRMLYNFRAEMQLRSPGSIVEIDTYVQDDGKVFFSRFFMAMKPCVDGFKAGCRPYLSIDSTPLNGKWNGQLAAAIALDGNNWMFPVAVGLFQSETEANWTWFLTQLYRSIGHMSPLAICTDACKGLENAVKNVIPHAEQRECFGHLWLNLVKKFQGQVFGRMWPAARAYKQSTYKYHMDKMLTVSEGGCEEFGVYLNTYHHLLWYRSGFNTEIKVDHINNYLAESFNSWIRDIKDLPVHELIDTIRRRLMNLFNIRRQLADKFHGDKLPTVLQQLVCKSRGLGHLHVVNASTNSSEVMDKRNKRRHVVKLHLHECSCFEWQATGKPCEHAIVVLSGREHLMGEFLHEYYSVARFKAAYAGIIEPLTDQSQWPEVDLEVDIHAPKITKHFKSFFERGGKKGTKGQMKGGKGDSENEKEKEQEKEKTKAGIGIKHRCKKCLEIGHRVKSPFCVFTPPKPKRDRGNNKTTEGTANVDEDEFAPHLEKCKSCLEPGHRAGSPYCILTPPKPKRARGRKKSNANGQASAPAENAEVAPAENGQGSAPTENAEDLPPEYPEEWTAPNEEDWPAPNAKVCPTANAEDCPTAANAEDCPTAENVDVEVEVAAEVAAGSSPSNAAQMVKPPRVKRPAIKRKRAASKFYDKDV